MEVVLSAKLKLNTDSLL